jgi:hypothetical protein
VKSRIGGRRVAAALGAQALVILAVNGACSSDDDCGERQGTNDFDLGTVLSPGADASPEAAADAIALLSSNREPNVFTDASIEDLLAMPCLESCRQVIEYTRPGVIRVDDCQKPTLGAERTTTVGSGDAAIEVVERAVSVHCVFTFPDCPPSSGGCIQIHN